jgi:multimeric flavodoxin WrbA
MFRKYSGLWKNGLNAILFWNEFKKEGDILILGISASGRKNGVTAAAVQAVLEATELKYQYISLAGKKINGCTGCTLCAGDNCCKEADDWNEIGELMKQADAIVFGAPNYFGHMNALGHACWERTFCFRHREIFNLAGKLGVSVSVEFEGADSVQPHIEHYMKWNYIVPVATVDACGHGQCYTCGYGHDCAVGKVVKDHGFLEKISPEQFPVHFNEQALAKMQAYKAGKILGSILRNR